jgi:hypothetical protein
MACPVLFAHYGGMRMKKASEYRRHAEECRTLARNAMSDQERNQLLNMAETWTKLAEERERMAGSGNTNGDADTKPPGN